MTKMKNMIVLIITVIIAAAFASCSNPVSPLYSTEALMEEAIVEDNSATAEAADSDLPIPAADDQHEDSDSSPVDEPIVKIDPSESKNTDSIDSTDDGFDDNEPTDHNEPADDNADDADESSDRSNGNSNKGPGNNNGQGKDQGNHYGWNK
jgi:hypothetical protein